MNTIGGFVPGSLGADPNWSKCLKCAAVDRARLRITPALARSDICAQCFMQYCFDPAHPPSKNELVGRKLQYQNPDPQRSTNTGIVLARRKKMIIGAIMSTLGFIMVVS
jgi:lysophospholipase